MTPDHHCTYLKGSLNKNMPEDFRKILEIGPAIKPMHHRSQDELRLEDGEAYQAVDKHPEVFDFPIWHEAKATYGDRVQTFHGDRAELAQIPDASIDELVALGTMGQPSETLVAFDRVLKSGGLLRFGTGGGYAETMIAEWGPELAALGYQPVDKTSYDYIPKADQKKFSYTVFLFQKP